MPSRLLPGAGALADQALRDCSPKGVATLCSMASQGGIPTDGEQATGLEREVMTAARKGHDPCNTLPPKEVPTLVPPIANKCIVGCICEGDSSAIIWFWLHKRETQGLPNRGAHCKLVPLPLPMEPLRSLAQDVL
ncbi:Cytochrome c oxidase subunit 5B, mitochondrial [Sciurus carolinensis]|uniref:Cytochrome c oxidase subunit 5B, mitochondrial n=1 Tax=Sciurus carolinensis TaxID=30640 RepID=A0AA41T200_SCICA|nr:Cytochrome c oxidase subunit 5B, mitochondrial [Sciurus carolinensis]